jgi:hypothetical protein
MVHLDPGIVLEIDVEDDAERVIEVVMFVKRVGGRKQHAVIAVRAQETLDAPEHAGIVVDHENCL